MRIDRLLAITIFLLNRKQATARELADKFEVSLRTIQRDMDALALAGIPLFADRGCDGGYRIVDDYTLDRQMFSEGELRTITSFVGKLHEILGSNRLAGAEEKLRQLGPVKQRKKSHEQLIMDLTPWGITPRIRELFGQVYNAVEEHRLLTIEYHAADGSITDRAIEPLSVILRGAAWYIYAFCRLRQAVRLFKITRISRIRQLSETFAPAVHPPYREPESRDGAQNDFTLFVLKFSEHARGRVSDYAGSDNIKEMPDGSLFGFFPFPEDDWVYGWLLSFGPLVEVLEPPHARTRLKELGCALVRHYD